MRMHLTNNTQKRFILMVADGWAGRRRAFSSAVAINEMRNI